MLSLLAAVACGHVQPHLVLPDLKVGEPAFAATSPATPAPVVPGNRVEILLNGGEIFPAKLALIRAATKTMNYAQYVFEEGAAPPPDVAPRSPTAVGPACR